MAAVPVWAGQGRGPASLRERRAMAIGAAMGTEGCWVFEKIFAES